MTEERLIWLLIQFLSREINPEEVNELMVWAAGDQVREGLVTMVSSGAAFGSEIARYIQFNPVKGFDRWKAERPAAESLPEKPRFKSFWLRWQVVAASLLVMVVGIYTVIKLNHQKPTAAMVVRTSHLVVGPGRNTAILTLSDGREIPLDSIHKEERLTDGNAQVVKTDSAELDYVSSGVSEARGFNTLTTPRSGEYQIRLPDGSKVWLNNESKIRYPTSFDGRVRTVELTGEAYFEIVADAGRPFFVKTRNEDVEVLGTIFNVMAYADEAMTKTTVVTGNVRVRSGKAAVVLYAGDQVQVDLVDRLNVARKVKVDHVVAWKNGFFYFDNTTLGEVMRQVSRWYDVSVEYTDTSRQVNFAGKVERSVPLSELLKFFDRNHMHCRLEGRKLLVQPD